MTATPILVVGGAGYIGINVCKAVAKAGYITVTYDNLFVALRSGFPADLDRLAIETDTGLRYSWRDLDRATAMVANLLDSLDLPPASRIAVQTEKSVEALMLYLAVLRAVGAGPRHVLLLLAGEGALVTLAGTFGGLLALYGRLTATKGVGG